MSRKLAPDAGSVACAEVTTPLPIRLSFALCDGIENQGECVIEYQGVVTSDGVFR